MTRNAGLFRWPIHTLPRIRTAGRFPMGENSRGVLYVSRRTHALHLHDYRAACRVGRRGFELQPGAVTLTEAGVESRYDVRAKRLSSLYPL